jgi:hypothetical protein
MTDRRQPPHHLGHIGGEGIASIQQGFMDGGGGDIDQPLQILKFQIFFVVIAPVIE